ncbi:E3 ubiquitin-protein ligase RNF19A [Papilio machaon]|uniref:RBR-type E3 ubiquitin transferase n=1 Tax=Papilio machaon TaxID=76193 RepID=A0A194R682_PAPMA|nr:E3 ubiquitin-protein ligase RNF19A [Papilio machaon]
MVRLAWCSHRCCESCLRQYLAIEISEARMPVNCPVCHENMHPQDVRRIVDNQTLYDKYEEFSVRRALAADPDTRWCPAPDCSFAVVATGCASCPKLTCQAPGCGASFCYHCKAAWHPTQTCDAARRSRHPPPRQPAPQQADMEHGEVKPCPRCSVLIVKVEDGSCNHMVCCVCGAEFCWLCMKEVSDLHYLSPSGCTFWGKKPWSRKKKLLWQLGTLAGAPLGIAVVAGRCRCVAPGAAPPPRRRSPTRRSATSHPTRTPPPDDSSPASVGDASLSAGSQQAEARAPSLAALAGSLGGHEAHSPSPAAHRLEVTADVAAADTASAASAASWPDDLPSTSSRSARLRSLFLYGAPAPPAPPDLEAGTCAPPPAPHDPPTAPHTPPAALLATDAS